MHLISDGMALSQCGLTAESNIHVHSGPCPYVCGCIIGREIMLVVSGREAELPLPVSSFGNPFSSFTKSTE